MRRFVLVFYFAFFIIAFALSISFRRFVVVLAEMIQRLFSC